MSTPQILYCVALTLYLATWLTARWLAERRTVREAERYLSRDSR